MSTPVTLTGMEAQNQSSRPPIDADKLEDARQRLAKLKKKV